MIDCKTTDYQLVDSYWFRLLSEIKKQGYKQSHFCRDLGLGNGTVFSMNKKLLSENNHCSDLRYRDLQKMAEKLGKTVSSLLYGEPEEASHPSVTISKQTQKEIVDHVFETISDTEGRIRALAPFLTPKQQTAILAIGLAYLG